MAVPSENHVMNTNLDDPVTKAVVDNIMGNLPTKKPLVRCEDCDLSFTSQAVLDTHLQGARHAKQVSGKQRETYVRYIACTDYYLIYIYIYINIYMCLCVCIYHR